MSKKLTLEEVKRRIKEFHGDQIEIVEESYIFSNKRAKFIDKDYGEFTCIVENTWNRKTPCGHPKRKIEKTKETNKRIYGVEHVSQSEDIKEKTEKTNMKRYGAKSSFQSKEVQQKYKEAMIKKHGVDNPMKSLEIARKNAKSRTNSSILYHWKTGEELVCQGGWEAKVVEYFNKNKINFEWQSKIFTMPDGRTYTPDCYLPVEDLWIEIKGRFIGDAEEKWDWFRNELPNSELWTLETLKEKNIL